MSFTSSYRWLWFNVSVTWQVRHSLEKPMKKKYWENMYMKYEATTVDNIIFFERPHLAFWPCSQWFRIGPELAVGLPLCCLKQTSSLQRPHLWDWLQTSFLRVPISNPESETNSQRDCAVLLPAYIDPSLIYLGL